MSTPALEGAPGVRVRPYQEVDAAAVEALWQQVFGYAEPRNAPDLVLREKVAWDHASGVAPLLIVAVREAKLVGTVLAGYDGHRGWLYRLAVAEAMRRQGVGRQLIRHAEDRLRALGCRKVNLQVHAHNEAIAGFWQAVGYSREARVSLGKDLSQGSPPSGDAGC